jgi:glycosyltransferase involved in cell wall biosynthesis
MKILHVLRAPIGGLFRHVVDLAGGQIERGHAVGIIADSTGGNDLSDGVLAALAPKLALGLTRIPIRRNPHPADLLAVWRVSRRIHDSGAEIVHGHGAKGGALARLAPCERPIIRAYTPHGGSLHDEVGSLLHLLMEQMLMPAGQLYLFESAYSQGVYRRKVGEPQATVRIVHNGIRRDELEPIRLVPGAADIVYLGELRDIKGVDVLIDAVARLRQRGRVLTANLVGDGPDHKVLHAKVHQAGVAEQIKFCGTLPTREALALGRIVALPSRAESFPYVVLEAAGAGKPLVATNVGGIPEIFGPYANRLIKPGDADALAQALLDQIDRPAETLVDAQALRERVANEFLADQMVDAVIASYQEARVNAARRASTQAVYSRPGVLT